MPEVMDFPLVLAWVAPWSSRVVPSVADDPIDASQGDE